MEKTEKRCGVEIEMVYRNVSAKVNVCNEYYNTTEFKNMLKDLVKTVKDIGDELSEVPKEFKVFKSSGDKE